MKPKRARTTQMYAKRQRVLWARLRLMAGALVEDVLAGAQRRFKVCAATARNYVHAAWDGFEEYARESRAQVREMRRAARANCLRWIQVADENMTRRVVRRTRREGTPGKTERCVDVETVTEAVDPAAVRLAGIANRLLVELAPDSAMQEEAGRWIVDFVPPGAPTTPGVEPGGGS